MKKHNKITLAGLAVILGILSGILTITEKSINIVNSLKPEASEAPKNNEKQVRHLAGRIENKQTKTIARGVK